MNQKKKSDLLFKKYYILSKIDEGSFGSIYLAKNKFTNEKVAIKVENRKQYKPLLEREAYILFYLKGPGLPEIKTFGKTREYFILVQTLLGPSLSALIDNYLIKFTIKDICMLSIQMIERLEYIHSKNFIHRDIKPHNFLMGLDDPNMLYIIDFGLSKKYRSKKGKHIKFSITNNITGTPRYCSINALRGAEQSRRDDLESLFYVILYFFRGSVPWQNLKIKSRSERFNKINEIKKKIDYKYLCKNLPEEVYNFGVYVKNLKFEQEPNYKYMKKLFYLILSKIKEIDDDKFSWINQNIITSKNNSHSRLNIFKDKPSIHQRLYEKIANSLEKKILIQKNNNHLKSQSIKDNITLVSLNIENSKNNINNKIKKSSSYAGANDIRVRYLMNKKNKNVFINGINNKKDNLINNKNIYNSYNSYNNYNYNKGVIKRNPTAIKTVKISKLLNEDMKNINNNEYNIFNINNNESIKNFFLRNNKVYTSPNLILDIKKLDNSNSNSNIIKNSIKKIISKNNSQIIQKSRGKNNIINKNIYPNYNNDISYNNNYNNNNNVKSSNNLKTKIINVNNNKNINSNINSKNSNSNITSSNIMNFTNSINNTTSSKFSNKNYMLTYNSEAIPKINLNLELEKRVKVNRTNSTTFPITNLYLNQNQINFTPESSNKRKNNNTKNKSLKNRIKLNIKLINNNNYNNVPLMIYNTQSDKLNNINNIIDKKNMKSKYRYTINNNINKIQNNPSRIIKYTIQRKIKTNHENNYDNEQYFQNEDDFHNKIKIMTIPKHKTQLDQNLSLYK